MIKVGIVTGVLVSVGCCSILLATAFGLPRRAGPLRGRMGSTVANEAVVVSLVRERANSHCLRILLGPSSWAGLDAYPVDFGFRVKKLSRVLRDPDPGDGGWTIAFEEGCTLLALGERGDEGPFAVLHRSDGFPHWLTYLHILYGDTIPRDVLQFVENHLSHCRGSVAELELEIASIRLSLSPELNSKELDNLKRADSSEASGAVVAVGGRRSELELILTAERERYLGGGNRDHASWKRETLPYTVSYLRYFPKGVPITTLFKLAPFKDRAVGLL